MRNFVSIKRKGDARLRIFCFPYAGGNAAVFSPWAERLDPRAEILIAEYPGRGRRATEDCCNDMQVLVEDMAQEMSSLLDLPYLCFGYSLGARVAYALADYLRSCGHPEPVHFIGAAGRAPHIHREAMGVDSWSDAELVMRLKRLGGTPAAILDNPDVLDYFLPIIRADFQLNDRYFKLPDQRFSCPVTIMGGDADQQVPREYLQPWQAHFQAPVNFRFHDGGHFFVHQQPDLVIAEINRAAAAAIRQGLKVVI